MATLYYDNGARLCVFLCSVDKIKRGQDKACITNFIKYVFKRILIATTVRKQVCAELFASAPAVEHVRLNLLILDAHAGVPLDIRPGGATEAALRSRYPSVAVQYEEPEHNCHLLASFDDMHVLEPESGALLAELKLDVSMTRLGKIIFRVSHAQGAQDVQAFTEEIEGGVRRACARLAREVVFGVE